MNKPIRILHVLNGLGTGGAEAIVMNWYRNIDREKVQFDFLIRSNDNIYAEEIAQYGGKVFIMPPYPRHYFKNKKATEQFFEKYAKEYSGIHVHGNALLYVNVFSIAKKNGINLRIYHSHSTNTSSKYVALHMINRLRIKRLATDFFACSKAAGEWAFKNLPFKIVKNGIKVDDFIFNEVVREKTRKSLGISSERVYGHIGRFEKVKNHIFLLEVFEKIVKADENSVLLLIGEGSLFDVTKKLAYDKGLDSKIRFLGTQKNVSAYLNAMDVFLLPSLNEGLGIVAIEAQTSGLQCVLANSIPNEVKITNLVKFIPTSDSTLWANYASQINIDCRHNIGKLIKSAGYSIEQSTIDIQEYYYSRL